MHSSRHCERSEAIQWIYFEAHRSGLLRYARNDENASFNYTHTKGNESVVNIFKTELIKKHKSNHARIMKITTPHGEVITPAFMPVATRAVVNHMTSCDLENSGSQIVLGGNTYHMLCT